MEIHILFCVKSASNLLIIKYKKQIKFRNSIFKYVRIAQVANKLLNKINAFNGIASNFGKEELLKELKKMFIHNFVN
jgi:hypothetical protein